MTSSNDVAPIRREPPTFRRLSVIRVQTITPYLSRVRLGGEALEGFVIEAPASSVRLLLPPAPDQSLVVPTWNGNEFLFDDGSRPSIRTFTPLESEPDSIALDIVHHQGGVVSDWVQAVKPGGEAAISGPGRGYSVDQNAAAFVIGGDETAMPAIGQLLAEIPPHVATDTIIEVRDPAATVPLPESESRMLSWVVRPDGQSPGTSLERQLRKTETPPGVKVWVAGEAASMHRIRKFYFDERGLERRDVTVRGYWKHGR